MNPIDLTVVSALQQAGSFSGAARILGVAHTTVARKLRALEEHYQTHLFDNGSSGLVPTAEGEQVLAFARKVEAEMIALERSVKGKDHRLTGTIRLTTVDVLAWRYMDTLARFRAGFPGIELKIEVGTDARSLSRREAEMALRLTNSPDEYLFGRKVGRLDFHPFVHKRLLEGSEAAPRMEELPWVEYGGADCAGPANRWMGKHLANVQASASVPTPLTMLRAVACGLGVGLLPKSLADREANLVSLSEHCSFSVDVWLLAPLELRQTARIRAMFETFAS